MSGAERLSEEPREALSPSQKFLREAARFGAGALRISVYSVFLLPIILASFLTLDLPTKAFDLFPVEAEILRPSQWLTVGQIVMVFTFPVLNIATRRYGGGFGANVVLATWGFATILLLAGLSYLAPALDQADMPPVRFIVSFVTAWMLAQFVCVTVFDLMRGVKWQRAPLYGNIFGGVAFAVIYFPALYYESGAPWVNWMLLDIVIKTMFAALFLAPYWLLRGVVRPLPGLGGR